jgi:peptide/nickel transport system substrate-binding protein
MPRAPRYGALLMLLLIGLVGCAPAAQRPTAREADGRAQQPAGPKRITAAIMGDPAMLSYAVVAAGTGGTRGLGETELLLHAGTAILGADGRLHPQLAQDTPTLENGLWKLLPDGRMETTWQLRPDGKWHDGTPVSAGDLLFTVQMGMDKDLPLLRHPAWDSVEAADAVDDRTVTVTWKRPYIEADMLFTQEILILFPRHLLEPTYTSNKAALFDLPQWTTDYVGAGPFRLKELVRNSHMTLTAFDGYVLGRPKVDEIQIRFIMDPNTLIANLLAGEVEMTIGRGMNIEQGIQVREQWKTGRMDASPGSWIAHYPQHLTPNPAVLGDVRFRRALVHALDRQEMSDTIQAGLAPVAHGWMEVTRPEFRDLEPSIVKYTYDPRRSAQLIEELGFQRAADGFYRDGAGQRLSVESRTNGGDDAKEKMLFSSADYWKRVGVDVDVVIVPRQQADDRQYRATYPGFDLVRQPFEPERFKASESPLPENGFRGKNRTRYMNAEYDALTERYFTTIPVRERNAVLGQIVHHISDNVLAIGLLYGPEPTLIGNRLVNVSAPGAIGSDETWNGHEWDVK